MSKDTSELDKKIGLIFGRHQARNVSHSEYGAEDCMSCEVQLVELFEQHFATQKQELLDWFENEVVGEDEEEKYTYDSLRAPVRNKLRQKQRQLIKQKREES